jgi:putative secretion ATPase (PEP-CTERM system associated)
MYESHFGLSGPPFQLVPDPGFFFGSRGHSNALAFLQSAAHQGDGFLVVTGEIGAGKTTLVRTLLEGLDAQRVLAATLVSTQLESGDLPLAILLAFGAPAAGHSKAELNAGLEAFLIDLASQGRRALLIVDEAQNLSRPLIEELRMLSNLQLGANALLQVFLVGQPDLRTQMQAKAMEQLRQRVTASCHLGPLDERETRAYVEHRLRRVGWLDRPPIDSQAFGQIHQWTAGIPRRINRLCNRLLLATFLERKDAVTAESVEQIARDLRAEIGESDEQPMMEESYVSHAKTAAPDPEPSSVPDVARLPLAHAAEVHPDAAIAGPLVTESASDLGQTSSPALAATPHVESEDSRLARPLPATPDAQNESGSGEALVVPDQAKRSAAIVEGVPTGALNAQLSVPPETVRPEQPVRPAETAIPDALSAFASLPAFSLAQAARAALGGDTSGRPPVTGSAGKSSPMATGHVEADSDALSSGALAGRRDEPVIEEDDDIEADMPAPPPGVSLAGVVAAHETSLPSIDLVLGRATAKAKSPTPDELNVKVAGASPRVPSLGTAPAMAFRSLSRADAARPEGVDLPLELSASPDAASVMAQPAHRESAPPVFMERPTPAQPANVGVPAAAGKAVLEPLVCLVDSPSDYVKARALGRVLSEYPELPSVLIVHTGSVANLDVGEEISGVMPQKTNDVHLDINEHGGAASAALAITRFDAVLRVYRPRAILAMGASDTLLTCSLFAHKSAIPVLRNDAGRRRAWSRPGEEMNALLLERLAETCYISDLATYYTLYRSGITTERVLLVGNLADNVVHFAAQHTVHPAEILRRVGTPSEALAHPRGYALCTVQFASPRAAHDEVMDLISMLTLVGRELPVLWATNEATLYEIKSLGKLATLKDAHIDLAPDLRYLDCVDLLRGARCLLSGNAGQFLDDAVTLGVPSVVLGQGMVVPVKNTEALQLSTALGVDQLTTVLAEMLAQSPEPREKQPFWDGATAARIAAHLCEWVPIHGAARKRGRTVSLHSSAAVARPRYPDAAIELMGVTSP